MDQSLAIVIAVADYHSFSRAAEALHLTQPAVSQHIRALENKLGARLFERTNKAVQLTKAGEIVVEHAREILGIYTHMTRLVDDVMNRAQGMLTIGASYTFGEYVLPHTLAQFRQQYPEILPSIHIGNTQEISEAVLNRTIDIGIVEGDVKLPGVRVQSLAMDTMVVIARADLTWRGEDLPNREDLCTTTWIVREPGSGTRAWEEHLFEQLHIRPDVVMEFGSTQIIKEAVEAGLGIALLSEHTIQKELKLGTLRVVPIPHTPLEREFSIIQPQSSFSPRVVDVFHDFVAQAFRH